MNRRKQVLVASLLLLGGPAAVAAAFFWMTGGWPRPPVSDAPMLKGEWGGAPPKSEPPERLRILSYNIHYGVGREDDFDRRLPRAEIERNLAGIAALIRRLGADIVLLQEVDFDSARTHRMDEMRILAEAAGLAHMAPVVTWKKNYLPWPVWPPSKHYGRMRSGQVVLSRWPIVLNRREALPKPRANPFWYNAFYLSRTLQQVRIDIAGRMLDVFNAHTEAYDLPNRLIHAGIIRDRVKEARGKWTILAGDFNAIPPEATLKRGFPDEPEADMSKDVSVAVVRELGLFEIIPPDRYRADEMAALSFPADRPNRRLDYLYFSPAFRLKGGRIVREAGTLSDHLPTFAELEW